MCLTKAQQSEQNRGESQPQATTRLVLAQTHSASANATVSAAAGEAIFFEVLETGWLGLQFLRNRLATSEGAVFKVQLLTVYEK